MYYTSLTWPPCPFPGLHVLSLASMSFPWPPLFPFRFRGSCSHLLRGLELRGDHGTATGWGLRRSSVLFPPVFTALFRPFSLDCPLSSDLSPWIARSLQTFLPGLTVLFRPFSLDCPLSSDLSPWTDHSLHVTCEKAI